jgi:DNA-binding transcriptional ArsR family regulator
MHARYPSTVSVLTEGSASYAERVGGDVDLAAVGALIAEPSRARILLALYDGRALPASVLASEAGVAPSTASEHLSRLVDGGFVRVEQHGRHRHYRLHGPEIAEFLESVARLAPAEPVRSLRDDTRQAALRRGRTCYNHLAGRLGVELLQALLREQLVVGHDGSFRPERERLSARSRDPVYRLTDAGCERLETLAVNVEPEQMLAHCVDWSEQRHHLAGSVAASLTQRMFELQWLEHATRGRSVHVTELGAAGLTETFRVQLETVLAAG